MPEPTPDPRATLELLTRLEELCALEHDLTLPIHRSKLCGDFAGIVPSIIRDLRRLELAAEIESDLMLRIKRLESDRDAGWQAADALAEALDELLYAISQWRQGGMRAEGCQLAEAGASKARAAYTAARAARNPNPEGRT